MNEMDVINPETNESHQVRLPMDSASYRSYVSEALAENVQLQEKKTYTLLHLGHKLRNEWLKDKKIALKLKNWKFSNYYDGEYYADN